MITLQNLRALLDLALAHPENPAIQRLQDRTVEGVARAYLGRICMTDPVYCRGLGVNEVIGPDGPTVGMGFVALDMSDPGTAHVLPVALALARGLDPGPLGMDVGWRVFRGGIGRCGWMLITASIDHIFLSRAENCQMVGREIFGAPLVAAEPNPITALELAVKHTLEERC